MSARAAISVLIPTRNGAATLDRVLSRCLEQLDSRDEVVIGDNASTDDTPVIAETWNRRDSRVRFERRQENIGFDRNVDALVQSARGRFGWLLGDDDCLEPDAVATVTTAIQRYPGVALVQAQSDIDIANLEDDVCGTVQPDELGWFCPDLRTFCAITAFSFGGLAGHVVDVSRWRSLDLAPWLGSGWIHVAAALLLAADGPSYVTRTRQVNEIPAPKRWQAETASWPLMLQLAQVYQSLVNRRLDPPLLRGAISRVQSSMWRSIVSSKRRGYQPDRVMLAQACRLLHAYPSFWLRDLPLLFAPAWLYAAIYKAVRLPTP